MSRRGNVVPKHIPKKKDRVRVPLPHKPTIVPDCQKVIDKALELCFEQQTDVVVYVDERQGVSLRTVRDITKMHLPPACIWSYKWSEVKRQSRR